MIKMTLQHLLEETHYNTVNNFLLAQEFVAFRGLLSTIEHLLFLFVTLMACPSSTK